jgi:tetratricopeptide (TPR) repeat protein
MSDLEILIETGNRLMDSQQYMEAISHYTRALELDSTLVDVRVDRGSCYFAVGRNEDAKSDFEIALEQDPEHAIAHFNLGIIYGSLGDESQMVEYWNKYLELDPDGELADRVRDFLQEHNLAESTDSI